MGRDTSIVYKNLFYYIVITLSISLAFAQGADDRNYILIGSMFFGPIIFFFSFKKVLKIDKTIGHFMLLLFIIPVIFNLHRIRWSSLMFTYMFLFYFLAGIHCGIKGRISVLEISNIVRKLLYAYVIVLVLQQLCVLLHLPILNASAVVPDKPWKLNSLSAEPSHTSRMIGVLMYVFLYTQSIISQKKLSLKESIKRSPKVWISFIWVTLTTMSGTAILIDVIILSMFITKRLLPFFICGIFVIISVGAVSDFTALHRASIFVQAVLTGDSSQMVTADHSASIRVVPWILCLQRINIFSLRSWIGEGPGSVADWISQAMPGVPEGWTGGGSASFIVEYGLIIGLFYLIFSFRSCYSRQYKIASIGLWFFCVLFVGINMQVAWMCIFMLFITKNFNLYENKNILQLA